MRPSPWVWVAFKLGPSPPQHDSHSSNQLLSRGRGVGGVGGFSNRFDICSPLCLGRATFEICETPYSEDLPQLVKKRMVLIQVERNRENSGYGNR